MLALRQEDGIRIAEYEPWMGDQLVGMIGREWGSESEQLAEGITRFYDHPYQKDKAIRTIALDGERVVGSQTWCSWPYLLDGRRLNSYQSGSSLVDPDYRSRGIFSRLLNRVDDFRKQRQMEFLLVIPNAAAVGSYRRLQWHNLVNQRWYVKLVSPLSLIRRYDESRIRLEQTPRPLPPGPAPKGFALTHDDDFTGWRRHFSAIHGPCFYFHHGQAGDEIRFELKPKLRGPIKELILGDIQPATASGERLREALGALIRDLRSQRVFTMLSACMNEEYDGHSLRDAFTGVGFRAINRHVPFFVKDFTVGDELLQASRWRLLRCDSDAW